MTRRPTLRSRQRKQAAEEARGGGDRARAMELYARAGEWREAAQLAAELGNDAKLVQYSLMGALGKLPEGGVTGPLQAAELLSARGHHAEAALLFERGRAFRRAGEAALAASQPLLAATYFKQATAWLQAVSALEGAGKLKEALQTAEEGVISMQRTTAGTVAGAQQLEELNLRRADLLTRVGGAAAAVQILRTMHPSAKTAELLERLGRHADAMQHYRELGLTEEASRLAARAPNRQRLMAQVCLQTGRPAEAGHLFSQLGLAREAAQAYAAAQEWAWAASRWEVAGEPLRAAEAYEKAGRLRDAVRCYEAGGAAERAAELQAQSSDTGHASALQSQGGQKLQAARKHLAAGDKTRAASLLMPLRPHEPGFTEGVVMLAPLLIEEGFCGEALERLRHVPAGAAPHLEIERDYWEGRCLEALSHAAEAMACYERVTRHDPGHRDARERLERLLKGPQTETPGGRPAARRTDGSSEHPVVGGKLAGRYEIIADLGRGGMGRVYKARDLELGELVAIKTVLAPDDGGTGEQARFLREVQICRRISHPNVVRVYDVARFAAGLFVTMEYLEGTGLDDLLAKEAPLSFERIRWLLTEIASGLHEAHTQGIVHRDLKPSNVMVTANRVKILDFGIASMAGLGARLTQTGFVMGSPMYMSPEQILGHELDGRADLYSLGVLAFTLVCGREPYDAADANALIIKHLREAPPDVRKYRPEAPAEWAALVDRLLAKKRQRRFQSASDVLEALAKLPV